MKSDEIRNTNKQSDVPRYRISKELSIALLRGIIFELLNNAVHFR